MADYGVYVNERCVDICEDMAEAVGHGIFYSHLAKINGSLVEVEIRDQKTGWVEMRWRVR